MRMKYPEAIGESEEELTRLEQRLRGHKTADRVRMLRLLKSGAVQSLKDCAPLVGYSVAQLTRWWECYREEGLMKLLKQHKPVESPHNGSSRRGGVEASHASRTHRDDGGCTRLPGVRVGPRYKNGKSLWWLFNQHRPLVQDRAQTTEESQC
jgi:transposase-like protein